MNEIIYEQRFFCEHDFILTISLEFSLRVAIPLATRLPTDELELIILFLGHSQKLMFVYLTNIIFQFALA